MIWVWITIAIVISYLLSDRKHNAWYHYLWMLLPIENAGIQVAGATIKPYMVFGVFIVLKAFTQKKKLLADRRLTILVSLIALTDIINGMILASIMQHILFAIATFICFSYCRLIREERFVEQISDICISTTIGFCAVFSMAYILFTQGVTIPGIMTTDRFSQGIVLGYIQSTGRYLYRLRGFTIDPNAVMTAFIPGFCFALFQLLGYLEQRSKWKNYCVIVLYIAVVFMTNSRMAQLCTAVIFFVTFFSALKEKRVNKAPLIIVLFLVLLVIIIVLASNTNILYQYIMNVYTQRSGVNDEAGRFSIWRRNIQTLFEMNKEWFGVGQNQIQYYTYRNKPCHNTWLEWICGVGLFFGSAMCIWEISPSIRALRKRRSYPGSIRKIMPLIISHIAICFMLTAVDHISNPNLIITTVLLHFMMDRIQAREKFDSDYFRNKRATTSVTL